MKKTWVFMLVGLAVGIAVTATAADPKGKQKEKLALEKSKVVEMTATVQGVDLENRVVTLIGPKGKVVKVRADEGVRNLPQIKLGDQVKARYYESVAVEVRKPGEVPPAAGSAQFVSRAKPGEKPGGVETNVITLVADIEAIDMKNETVTLKGPKGNRETVKVQDPKNLENVQVGDQVVITYTEAVAISVERP
jgi:propanediol utilization protein